MHKPVHAIEIFLQPGEVYFGDRDTRIRTLLGSCVAITMWHPTQLVGGMCHYMLPKHPAGKRGTPDGRYGDEALELMLREIRKTGTCPSEYQVKLFGGGHMFSARQKVSDDHVGAKNVEMARILMKLHGFTSFAEHLGGVGHRNIFFNIWNGHVWVRHQPPVPEENLPSGGDSKKRKLCK
ncbi:MAG: chemotaxis protein CheD [Gallionella sp.]|nr:chemotaxis protein CheD [Gallionella sp.]